jgi:hypothetical protein
MQQLGLWYGLNVVGITGEQRWALKRLNAGDITAFHGERGWEGAGMCSAAYTNAAPAIIRLGDLALSHTRARRCSEDWLVTEARSFRSLHELRLAQ